MSSPVSGPSFGGRYRLHERIGAGGMGVVYRGEQLALGRIVAIKMLRAELGAVPEVVRRFHIEARASSRLFHPGSVAVYDYGLTDDGLLYIAMEYVKGPTLTQLVGNEHPLPHDRVLEIVGQILAGIEEAHLAGVVHADLKSDNVIVDQRRAGTDVVKLVDFGIARLVTAPRDGDDRNICGTPEYMAPEVISGAPPGFAADLYAVGIILYELLTCQTPFFGGTTIEILSRQLRTEPAPPSKKRPEITIGSEIDAVIKRALAKHPGDRYSSAVDMRQAVVALAEKLAQVERAEDVICGACNARCAPTFRFCPECGHPRAAKSHTIELGPIPQIAAEKDHILPLPLIGAAAEQRAIVDHLRGKSRGAGLIVIGPPGSGRSRLVQDTCAAVATQVGLTVYQTGADPSGLSSTYYPIRAVIASVLALPPVCTEDELRASMKGLDLTDPDLFGIAQLFGHDSPLLELEPPVRRRETVASILRVVQAVAARAPMALVFDDVERYDHPSLEVLRRISEGAPALPVVLIASPAHAEQWPAEMPRVTVKPLDAGEIAEVHAAVSRHGVAVPPPATLIEHTAGLPAHLDHLLRYVIEGGALEGGAMSIGDVIAARLSMLAQPTLDLLQAAAVFGDEVDLDVLRMTSPGQNADQLLHDAVARGLVGDDPYAVRFGSSLIRNVVYDATPADVRRALHAVAADALGAVSADPAALGHHHDLAGHASKAVGLLGIAGDRASQQLDDVSASQMYQRALRAVREAMLSGDDDDHSPTDFIHLSVKLAEALRARGEIGLARGVVAEARSWANAPALEASLDRAHGMILAAEDDHDGAATQLRRGIGRAIASGDMTLVCDLYIDLANLLARTGQGDAARRELVECLDLVTLGEGIGAPTGPENLWMVLKRKAQIVSTLGELDRALRLAEAALHHAVRVKSRLGKARIQSLLADLCERLGQTSRAERYRKAAVEEMRRLGDRRATAELLLTDTSHGRSVRVIAPGDSAAAPPVPAGRKRDESTGTDGGG